MVAAPIGSFIDQITKEVQEIAAERSLRDDQAFGYWFLEQIHDFSEEESEELVVDGPWDKGRDAVYVDTSSGLLRIYQFKWSDNVDYASHAIKDVQRGLVAERTTLPSVSLVQLIVATKAAASQEMAKRAARAESNVRSWLKRNKFVAEVEVELFDLRSFARKYDQLYGPTVTVSFSEPPLEMEDGLLGRLNAADLAPLVETEQIFDFNIRKSLGIRKGSVNYRIKLTLEDPVEQKRFWTYNNGIVCLSTAYTTTRGRRKWECHDFSVVNGAQTLSTIQRYLEDNPAERGKPVWVVAKVVKVDGGDLAEARKITARSNSQSPASDKDLKSIDPHHRWIDEWMTDLFGVRYVYQRGGKRLDKGVAYVDFKDVSQAFVAARGEPHVAFARPGTIFRDPDYYDKVFPTGELQSLRESGTTAERQAFVGERLFGAVLLRSVREKLRKLPGDSRYRSLAYHCVWVFGEAVRYHGLSFVGEEDRAAALVDKYLEDIFDGLREVAVIQRLEVPRDLKSEKLVRELESLDYLDKLGWGKRLRDGVKDVWS